MSQLNEADREALFIGLVLEGLFYGLYSGIFVMYLQYKASEKGTDRKQNIVFYAICVLYLSSVALFVADIILPTYQFLSKPIVSTLRLSFIQMTLFGCCDFIAQFILIYRCWIVWGRDIRVVIIPLILAFVFLVVWIAGGSSDHRISSTDFFVPAWGHLMNLLGITLSLTVNALVTGLIVFKIFKVFRQVKATSDFQILRAADGSKLRRTILILIESGMTLFSIQLVRVAVAITINTGAAFRAFWIVNSIQDMLIGITPTIILVRLSMGLSFHDQKSMEDFAIGSLSFVFDHPNPVTEIVGIVGQDRRDDDLGVQRSNDIDIIER